MLPDRQELYVEPQTLVASGGELLLAGAPSYLWRRETASPATLSARDSAFGAVISRDGRARLVPWPIPRRSIGDVRAAPRDSGGWSVVFAELVPKGGFPKDGPVTRLWYGVFDGRTWTHVEELPLPEGALIREGAASLLVRQGAALHWALPIEDGPNGKGVAYFTRRGSAWSHETVRTYATAYVALAHSDSLGMMLLVVHPDTTLRQDRNSLFLYARRPGWGLVRKMIPGAREPVHHPVLTTMEDVAVLTWTTVVSDGAIPGSYARALIGRPGLHDGRVIALAPTLAQGLQFVPLGGRRLWMIDHATTSATRELHFVTDSAGSTVTLARWPYPFAGSFAAVAVGDEVLLAGPMRGATENAPVVVTLLLRARLDCERKVH
ncbi:MAG: hypothetical protein ACREON_14460 [Gemmatimonadaceae bacterium]